MENSVKEKVHFHSLDGLRGVAAIVVVIYHVFEGYQFVGDKPYIEFMNHGYLAVDFFFMLSGFVIGYAYDDRLSGGMSIWSFFKRRLVRLHPMLVVGTIIGLVSYMVCGAVKWNGEHMTIFPIIAATVCGMLLLPATQGSFRDVRGNGEMFPLNGPSWSLFFEYIGNFLYGIAIRKLSVRALATVVSMLAIAMAAFSILDISGYGMIGVGWTLDAKNLFGGLLRMSLPFTIGLLLWRIHKDRLKIQVPLYLFALLLVLVLAVPYMVSPYNGVFEIFVILFVFPMIIRYAPCAKIGRNGVSVCKMLGNLSYPLYIVHYPIMYAFYQWMIKTGKMHFLDSWWVALLAIMSSIVMATLCFKVLDVPLRKWLSRVVI